MRRKITVFALLSLSLLFVGCASKEDELAARIKQTGKVVEQRLDTLKHHLDHDRLSNAKLIKQYAKYIKKHSPELMEIASTLEEEGGSKGALYQGLKIRYMEAVETGKTVTLNQDDKLAKLVEEFTSIANAAGNSEFNMALTDPLNVLSDMSGGKLPRVGAGSAKETEKENGAASYGRASALVGNPNYGGWQSQSNGTSIWAFYGQYRLFSDLLSGPVSYGHWSRHRDYSYYNDTGRKYYSSPGQRNTAESTQRNAKKRFAARGDRFEGPYNRKRATASKVTPRKLATSVTKAPRRLSSSYSSGLSTRSLDRNSSGSNYTKTTSSTYSSRGSYGTTRSYGGGGK